MSQDNPTHWLISTRHVTAAPLPRLARAVRALAALLDELEQQALAHGRVRDINLELQAPRVRLRPDEARVAQREGVAGLQTRREAVDEIQCFFSEQLRLDAS